jgi:hypothetical protein
MLVLNFCWLAEVLSYETPVNLGFKLSCREAQYNEVRLVHSSPKIGGPVSYG